MAASYDIRLEQVDGRVHTSTTHCKRLRIDLKPDFQALGAFVPDVPDGTPVYDVNTQEKYVWEGGGFMPPADKEVGKSIKARVAGSPLEKGKARPLDAERVLKDALRKAKKDNKKVLVRLSSPGCVWCLQLANVLGRKEVADTLNRDYVSVEIDLFRMRTGRKLAANSRTVNA